MIAQIMFSQKKKFNAEKDAVRNSVGSNSPVREN